MREKNIPCVPQNVDAFLFLDHDTWERSNQSSLGVWKRRQGGSNFRASADTFALQLFQGLADQINLSSSWNGVCDGCQARGSARKEPEPIFNFVPLPG